MWLQDWNLFFLEDREDKPLWNTSCGTHLIIRMVTRAVVKCKAMLCFWSQKMELMLQAAWGTNHLFLQSQRWRMHSWSKCKLMSLCHVSLWSPDDPIQPESMWVAATTILAVSLFPNWEPSWWQAVMLETDFHIHIILNTKRYKAHCKIKS